MKEPLLYLCHRIPYPPNKGDKITTFNILKFLNRYYDVYVGCFIDDPHDKQYKDKVKELCKDCFFVDLNPLMAKVKGLTAFGKGEPITLPYYYNTKMLNWVNTIIPRHHITKAFIYSGCMAQYVLTPETEGIRKVMQFADIDSDKWRQYAEASNVFMRSVYMREYRTLSDYEKLVADKFSISCFISDTEADMFREMVTADIQPKVQTLSNGIDSDYFSPSASSILSEDFELEHENYIVFTGAMDYRPNIETVNWFTEYIWPKVIEQCPDSKFYIVGSSPPKQVLDLMNTPGVVVTGRVDDVRPYLLYSKAAVAPMKMARGIQNKILEAMAMERPVMTTSLGVEGIDDYPSNDLFVTDSNLEMTKWIIEKLSEASNSASDSRKWLEDNFSWEAKLNPLLGYLGANSD
ncbi:TIGR03087 family PEP-CTERM/XrtA system glycosyltransferase [Photobacterium sp. BZF1]|uniref:TIGR03087 family PEP-CTERM/XrtA system glycosyltransferase n=1 Tax=Photobacterium sp. BZF1 TaxID=1904457 RepID=UPI00165394D4|nr:TIGR03087 family PEP-CTERM/XrtA system glycosyltransferase [Photobacterium sp. BZF1]MBC7004738.1 TIGR03087 family PEP-CTERM/XrtA system glycosyltransferase [Photobacterium sp. BZF1]